MNILAVDTSGPVAGVAVLSDGKIVYEGAAINPNTHSVNLLPMVEEALTRSGLPVKAIDLFASVVGPGSFTGVRIGVCTIKGMAHGAGKPCVGIDALEALAAGLTTENALICPIQDARACQVYGAAFTKGLPPKRMLGNQAMELRGFVRVAMDICKNNEKLCFVGDGVEPHRKALKEMLGERACFLPAHLSFLRPASVAVLAETYANRAVDYYSLQPSYLRAPQAERERKSKEAGNRR